MGPPRRNPSHTASLHSPSTSESSASPHSPLEIRQSAIAQQQNYGMSPASRYQHNLKVLRRRDPSILSIFDQFSHVCLYHHNGKKWEKHGYEGSMFLYERDSYPPYGFYILNRMGMDDHIQRLYPEDNIGAHGSYLIIRSYPEFTARRLAVARASSPHGISDKFSNLYALPDVDKFTAAEKGDSETIGLWMFTTDEREPLFDVFSRLHSYIKKNIPYPQEFRYGPDRPRPSNPPARVARTTATYLGSNSQKSQQQSSCSEDDYHSQGSQPSLASLVGPSGGLSELDKLFAKIGPAPILSTAATTPSPKEPRSASTSTTSASTSKMTVETLFAALGGQDLTQPTNVPSSPAPHPSSSSSTTGISLLNDIFASADPSKSRPAITQSETTTPSAKSVVICSPSPATNTVPQILSQDVISTLMGLPPSRTPSAASTTYSYSSGGHSHPSSREGDNENESDHGTESRTVSEDGHSESSTVLDPEGELDKEPQGASTGNPIFTANLGSAGLYRRSPNGYFGGEIRRTQGDVTPRAPMNGLGTSSFARPNLVFSHSGVASLPPSLSSLGPTASTSTTRGTPQPPRSNSRPNLHNSQASTVALGTARPLVPPELDSEPRPYSRDGATETDVLNPTDIGSPGDDSDEILELDFEDTSVLSDPDVFKKGVPSQKGKSRHYPNISVSDPIVTNGKGRKGRKERARVREEIENPLNVPAAKSFVAPAATVAAAAQYQGKGRIAAEEDYTTLPPPASPSPRASPSPPTSSPAHVPARAGEPQNHRPSYSRQRIPSPSPWVVDSRPQKVMGNRNVNGAGSQQRLGSAGVDTNAMREALISAMVQETLAGNGSRLERKESVREVLTLIHTDKAFVDTLWREYASRVG